MVSVIVLIAVGCGFEFRSRKDYGICSFSSKHAAFKRNNKEWLARNQDNVSECGDISTQGLLL
jgi:hypothetical protein